MHVCQARRLTQVSSPAGEAGSVRRRLRMSPCALFSYSRYLRSSGAWLALSASDFLRSAKRGEFVGASFAPVLRRAERRVNDFLKSTCRQPGLEQMNRR